MKQPRTEAFQYSDQDSGAIAELSSAHTQRACGEHTLLSTFFEGEQDEENMLPHPKYTFIHV